MINISLNKGISNFQNFCIQCFGLIDFFYFSQEGYHQHLEIMAPRKVGKTQYSFTKESNPNAYILLDTTARLTYVINHGSKYMKF
jgi:uncharacterized protein YebE (UPF0316 family)